MNILNTVTRKLSDIGVVGEINVSIFPFEQYNDIFNTSFSSYSPSVSNLRIRIYKNTVVLVI